MTEPVVSPAQTVPVSPLLGRHGAVAGEGADAAVPWHYGDPTREQRMLAEGLAVVDLSHRGVVTVTGPDRLTWLHSITSQHLSDLAPFTSTEALILTPKGHVEHALHLVDDGATTWITCEPGTSEALVAWLRSMQFMLRVEVADRTADLAVIGEPIDREGGRSEPPTWRDPWPRVSPGSVSYAAVDGVVDRPRRRRPDPSRGGPARVDEEGTTAAPAGTHPGTERAWREVIVPRADLVEIVGGRPLAGTWASEASRVAAWRPRLGHETDHRTIPHEVDWLRTAVHLQKGCYRGQETVARVHNLGRPPRRLVMLHLDGSTHLLPPAGARVMHGDRAVGQVTTSARHHELGTVALALVKRSLATDVQLIVDGIDAAQEVVVAP